MHLIQHQDEAQALSQSISKLKALPPEQLLQVVGVEDKIAKKEVSWLQWLSSLIMLFSQI
jgi:hypothetical protein